LQDSGDMQSITVKHRVSEGVDEGVRTSATVEHQAVRHRLLLAEDDSSFRYLLASALRRDGHQVVAVANGLDLTDLLGDSLHSDGSVAPFDLVLSDICMPGWPGLEALARVGMHPNMPPFILFTAFGDEDVHRRAAEMGALTLLDKPFDIDYLREIVAQALMG
jgi:CheY-like chemotaxis protein